MRVGSALPFSLFSFVFLQQEGRHYWKGSSSLSTVTLTLIQSAQI